MIGNNWLEKSIHNSEKCINKGHSADFNSNEYKDVLNNRSILRHTMKKITYFNHKTYTGIINKGSLSCFDDKVYLKDDGIDILLHGHKDIPKNKKMKESKWKIFLNIKKIYI